MNLIYNSKVINSSAVSVGSKSTIFGPSCDMAAADCVMFLVCGNTNFAAVGSSLYLHLQGSSDNSSWVNYGSTVASRSTNMADGDQRYMAIDCVKPAAKFRYMRPALNRSTGNFAFACLQYNLKTPGSTDHLDSTAVHGASYNTFTANISSS
jgi:hypothetical protein